MLGRIEKPSKEQSLGHKTPWKEGGREAKVSFLLLLQKQEGGRHLCISSYSALRSSVALKKLEFTMDQR